MSNSCLALLNGVLAVRVNSTVNEFVRNTQEHISTGVTDDRFTQFVSLASRHVPRQLLAPTLDELAAAQQLLPGWSLQHWTLLELVRITFVLARRDLTALEFPTSFNRWFTFADEGEACAYYRSLCLLPNPERHVWRAAEGCRTNMRTVFTAVACDSPYPLHYFSQVAWNQLVLKALFIGEPLNNIYGVNLRTTPELIAMVNDFVDERYSAGRSIPDDVCLLLSPDQHTSSSQLAEPH